MEDKVVITNEFLVEASMHMIACSGDAQQAYKEALKFAKSGDFVSAKNEMEKADEKMVEAHQKHTIIVQACFDQEIGYNILFAHAQDTMMTIKSEITIAKELLDIIKMMKE